MKQDKVSFNHINIGNFFISYKLHKWSRYLTIDYAPGDCLFGAIKLTKNTDPYKYGYRSFVIGFDRRSEISLTNGVSKSVFIFGTSISSSRHIDITRKDILVLAEGPTQGLIVLNFNGKCLK